MSRTTTKRQYNNPLFMIDKYLLSVQFNGFTPDGKSRRRIGIIDTANNYYLHEIVYTTTSNETDKDEAERVLNIYREALKA